MSKVFVGHVSSRVNERSLEEIFGKHGKIDRIHMKNGFAFIHYFDPKDADAAIRNLDGYRLDGDRLVVEWAKDSLPDAPRSLPMAGVPRSYRSDIPRAREEFLPERDRDLRVGRDSYYGREREHDRPREAGRAERPCGDIARYPRSMRDEHRYGDRYHDRELRMERYERDHLMPSYDRERDYDRHVPFRDDRGRGGYDGYSSRRGGHIREPDYDRYRDYHHHHGGMRDQHRADMDRPLSVSRVERNCFNCGGVGHISRDCDKPSAPRSVITRDVCYNCGRDDHRAKDCPKRDGHYRRRSRSPADRRLSRSSSPISSGYHYNRSPPILPRSPTRESASRSAQWTEPSASGHLDMEGLRPPNAPLLSPVKGQKGYNLANSVNTMEDPVDRSPSPIAEFYG